MPLGKTVGVPFLNVLGKRKYTSHNLQVQQSEILNRRKATACFPVQRPLTNLTPQDRRILLPYLSRTAILDADSASQKSDTSACPSPRPRLGFSSINAWGSVQQKLLNGSPAMAPFPTVIGLCGPP